jgi:hypothetical protein
MVGFGLPIIDMETPQNILGLAVDLCLGSGTNQFIHRSPFPDVILDGIHELFVRVFHILGVSDEALETNEDLDCHIIGVNNRYIGEHRVRRNCFWASLNRLMYPTARFARDKCPVLGAELKLDKVMIAVHMSIRPSETEDGILHEAKFRIPYR